MEEQQKRAKVSFEGIRKASRLYQYAKPFRWQFAVGLLMLALSSATSLAFPKLLGDLINAAQAAELHLHINRIGIMLVAVLALQSLFPSSVSGFSYPSPRRPWRRSGKPPMATSSACPCISFPKGAWVN